MLKGSNRMRLWFKLAEISGEMEGENTMEKRLSVFQARLRFVFDCAKSFVFKYHYAMGPGWFDTQSLRYHHEISGMTSSSA